jgi:hypothetical protein
MTSQAKANGAGFAGTVLDWKGAARATGPPLRPQESLRDR